MSFESKLPTVLTVILTAAIDSINPCAMCVLILMMSVVLAGGGTLKRMLFLGFVYCFAVFAVYLAAGIGLVYFLGRIPLAVTEYLSISVALLVVLAGILEIKDTRLPRA